MKSEAANGGIAPDSKIAETQMVQSPGDFAMALPFRGGRGAASYDVTTPEGKAKMHRALHGASKALKGVVGSVIEVEHVTLYPREFTLDDGEVREYVQVTFTSPTGEQWHTGSPHATGAAVTWSQMIGNPPWNPAQRFRVVARPGSKGREFITLEPEV